MLILVVRMDPEPAAPTLPVCPLQSEASLRVKEREVERLSKLLSAAQTAGSSAAVAGHEASRRAEEELAAATKKLAQVRSILIDDGVGHRQRIRAVWMVLRRVDGACTHGHQA